MRSLWTGAVSFGLVHIPVRLYAATESKDLKFRFLHRDCHTPIRYEKVCPTCRRTVAPEEIVRGYEYEPGRYVLVQEEDLARLPTAEGRSIDILDFVDLTEVDPIYFEKAYYLEPQPGGEKPYALLRQAMRETGKVAVARVALRTRYFLALIRARSDVLVLETLFYPDEVRSVQDLAGINAKVNLHPNEVKMANTLIENLASTFDPRKYDDEYRRELTKLVESKIAGKQVATPPVTVPAPAGQVIDLMEALRASLAAVKTRGTQKRGRPSRAKRSAAGATKRAAHEATPEATPDATPPPPLTPAPASDLIVDAVGATSGPADQPSPSVAARRRR